jgi:hypothetical protein
MIRVLYLVDSFFYPAIVKAANGLVVAKILFFLNHQPLPLETLVHVQII